ncbi:MAG: DNA primase [Sphingorhabdus sp.]
MSLTTTFLDELRARTTLSTLIGRTVKVTKAGREFKACCPFHNEKTPSFTINDEKGFYHCFGCGAHGDAIRWMTDQRGLPFMDAVKELAANAGMEVPAADPRAAERAERANSLYDVMTAAADWFTEQLGSIAGAEARAYLEQRGLNAGTIKAFGIGFAPDSRGKLRTALAKFGDAALIEAGLLISVDEKEPYDRFRGRLMIPIRDPRGRVIAFGGRILGAGEPKYLNSPDTPLFDKGRTLYNLDRAAAAARKSERVIVVEGYMDVIALAQAGYEESVAPLGTALTEDQIARLWRVSDCPTICFDGDSAGQKAALRAINRALPYLEPGKSLQFVTLPAKLDPDDVVRKQGKAAFDGFLADAKPLDQFLWSAEQFAEPLGTPEARAGFGKRLRDHARMIRDEDVRTQYLAVFSQRLREFFSPNISSGRKYFSEKRGFPPASAALTGGVAALGIDQAMVIPAIFAALTRHPHLIARHAEAIGRLAVKNSDMRRFRQLLFDLALGESDTDARAIGDCAEREGLGPVWHRLQKPNGIAFSFLRPNTDSAKAEADLAAVIEQIAVSAEIGEQIVRLDEELKSTDNWTKERFSERACLQVAEFSAMERIKTLLNGNLPPEKAYERAMR